MPKKSEQNEGNELRILKLLEESHPEPIAPREIGRKTGMRFPYLEAYLWRLEGKEQIWWDRTLQRVRVSEDEIHRKLSRLVYIKHKGIIRLERCDSDISVEWNKPRSKDAKSARKPEPTCVAEVKEALKGLTPDERLQWYKDHPKWA